MKRLFNTHITYLPTSVVLLALLPHSAVSEQSEPTYKLGPDSLRQEGVPKGTVTKHQWLSEKVYPGTVRDYQIFVPAQYRPNTPACVMVFQDGWVYVKEDGPIRVPIVFDNLIH